MGVIYAGFADTKMHDLWDHGDFHLDFKERPGRHSSLWQVKDPNKACPKKANR